MDKNKKKRIFILCLVFSIFLIVAVSAVVFPKKGQQAIEKWKLNEMIVYDKRIEQEIERLLEDEMDFVFWQENPSDTITNLDYNRSIEVKTMGIAGDVSILFPNSNRLAVGETGYCILGEDTAWQLFGSTKIIGRSVQINGETYQVAGIEYQEEKLCVYELTPELNQGIEYVAVRAKNREQMEMDKRKLEILFSIF